jgi:hypothetical protein
MKIMKAKKIAILLVSASLTMGTVGTMTVLADPPAMSSEMPPAPEGEAPQAPEREAPQAPDIKEPRFPNWHRGGVKRKHKERPSDRRRHKHYWKVRI